MTDEQYYKRKEKQDERRNKSLSMARKRGEVAIEWFKTNTLTSETQPEFNKLMKETDKTFKQSINKAL